MKTAASMASSTPGPGRADSAPSKRTARATEAMAADVVETADVLQALLLRAEVGVAVLVASHSPAVAAAADRVITLADGRVAA